MYGVRGSSRRRRLIRAEFTAGVIGCCGLGIWILAAGKGWLIVGLWLVGAGANYLALAVEAQRLSRPGVLDAHMSNVDIRGELRTAGRAQLWIAVPFALCVAAILYRRRDG
jgi:hypothetical protein